MALYHFSVKQVKRSEGHSSVAAAAYISGEKLYDCYYGEIQDYTEKSGVVLSEIILPDHVPDRLTDRETLWNEVESHENRIDAQLAYSFDIALQNELTMDDNIEIARRFVLENFTSRGMICDLAIHDPPREEGAEPNPHIHVLVPMRPINAAGEWGPKRLHTPVFDEDGNPVLNKKGKQKYVDTFITDWEKPETLEEWRTNWEKIVNERFAENDLPCRIDHRSHEKRGLEELPQVHEGSSVRSMEKKGIVTYKGEWNRWVKKTNETIRGLLNKISELVEWIKEAKERVHRIEDPTISNMVMQYFEHRDEVAEGFKRGSQKAKLGNLKYASKVQVYITQNKLTTIDDLEKLVAEKNVELETLKKGIEARKTEVTEIRKNLKLLEDYHTYKPVYDELNKTFFKTKKEAYRNEHHSELSKFYKARRILKEQGYDEADFDRCDEDWRANLVTLESEIRTESEMIKNSPISEEVKMLGYIRDAVDYVTGKNGDGGRPGGRVSVKEKINEKTGIVRKTEEAKRSKEMQEPVKTRDKKKEQSL